MYDAVNMMTIVVFRVQCSHHDDHHHSYIHTMRILDFCFFLLFFWLYLWNEKSYWRSADVKTTKFSSAFYLYAWATRPERPKGVRDEVKQNQRVQSRPKGPPARSRSPEGP